MGYRDVSFDIEKIKAEIAASSAETAIYIGADSKQYKRYGEKQIVYCTVVIVHRDGNKGAKIFKSLETQPDYGNFRQRLMHEVELAVSIGYELAETIGDRPFQIHLDINPDPSHKSSILVKEASGWVLGMFGQKPVLKPDAFAASSVSDRDAVKESKKRRNRRGKKYVNSR